MTDKVRGFGESAASDLSSTRAFSVLELFCGIGGCAEALRQLAPGRHRITAAIDLSPRALAVYRHNFPAHRTLERSLHSIARDELERLGADLWWLSPPCQPFTRRGLRRDDEDPRARPLLALIARISDLRPRYLALENVPGFDTSHCHARLVAKLEAEGYEFNERLLCPSELGWPNRRRRYYLLASREPLAFAPQSSSLSHPAVTLSTLLDELGTRQACRAGSTALEVEPALIERYRHALSRAHRGDPEALTACFTAAYGRSPVRSGSYLEGEGGTLRRFSPTEILSLLGFGAGFELPQDLPLSVGWRLAGNSLSIPAVKEVLRTVPELAVGASLAHAPDLEEATDC